MCASTKLNRKVREFRVLGTKHYSDHRPLSLTLDYDTNQPINIELHQIMTDELMSAPTPFKWIRSDDPTKDTSTLIFKEAQTSQTIKNNIVDLLNRSTWSAEDAIKLNQEVVATFTKAVASVATIKSCKRPKTRKSGMTMIAEWANWWSTRPRETLTGTPTTKTHVMNYPTRQNHTEPSKEGKRTASSKSTR